MKIRGRREYILHFRERKGKNEKYIYLITTIRNSVQTTAYIFAYKNIFRPGFVIQMVTLFLALA